MKTSFAKLFASILVLLALTFGALGVTPARAVANPLINEIFINPPGLDTPNEYIELRGGANDVLPAGTYLLGIEGDASAPGDVQDIFNLSGFSFGSNGYLVLLQSGSTYNTEPNANVLTATGTGWGTGVGHTADASATDIENASVTFLLINAASAPSLTDDIDSNNDGTADGAIYAGWTIYDGVSSLDNSAAGDFGYAAPTFFNDAGGGIGPAAQSVGFTASYLGRAAGDTTGHTAADWVAGDITSGTAPAFTLGSIGNTFPASYAGAELNHIGASNFLVLPTATTTPTSTSTKTSAPTKTSTPTKTDAPTKTETPTKTLTPTAVATYSATPTNTATSTTTPTNTLPSTATR